MRTQVLETTFEVRVPVPLVRLGFDQHEIQRRLSEWLVLSLFTEGRDSIRQSCALVEHQPGGVPQSASRTGNCLCQLHAR